MAKKVNEKEVDILTSKISDGKDAKKVKDGVDKSGKGVSKSTKKIISSVVAVVLVVALVAGYFLTGFCRNGILATFSVPQKVLTAATITDGEGNKHNVKVSTYNYYYSITYNNLYSTQQQYGEYEIDLDEVGLNVDFDKKLDKQTTTNADGEVITWSQYLEDSVMESIRTTYLYYYEAVAENGGEEPEITEAQKTELEETLKSYKETANKYGYTLNAYLKASMGKGVNEKTFVRESTIAYIADNYKAEYQAELASTTYTDADIEAYRDEHIADLVSVDAQIFECDSEDDAIAFRAELKADGSNFAELCVKYSEDEFSKKVFADANWTKEIASTKSDLKNKGYAIATAAEHTHEEGETHSENEAGLYPGLDWLFSEERKAGESYQYSTTVVYLTRPAGLSDVTTVDVRHILVSPADNSSNATKASDEEWAAALTKAQGILDQYNAGEKTSESFAELAKANSLDGSASKGGLYENVYPNQMVSSFNAWCFDGARQHGDVDIVKSQYGYHIMFFEEANEDAVWEYNAKQTLASTDSNELFSALDEEYTIKVNSFGSLYFQKDVDIDS